LVAPLPYTLESTCTLNSINFASNVDNLELIETDLNEGNNTLTAVVTDNTLLQRIDNHEAIHAYTVTWNINISTIGITEITSEENKLSISMFPNPSQDLLNFSYKSSLSTQLTIEIISLDGKKILTTEDRKSTRLNSS